MSKVIIWDTKENSDERYTVLAGHKAFVFGESAQEDPKNITVISGSEVDVPFMDSRYERIPATGLPKPLVEAVLKRG